MRVVRFARPAPLAAWCAEHDVEEAIVGGFYVRATETPLGELRTSGIARDAVPFDAPWDARQACVLAADRAVTIARRPELPADPRGDLLQAGRCSSPAAHRAWPAACATARARRTASSCPALVFTTR